MKICSKCGIKSDNFGVCSANNDKLQRWCRSCFAGRLPKKVESVECLKKIAGLYVDGNSASVIGKKLGLPKGDIILAVRHLGITRTQNDACRKYELDEETFSQGIVSESHAYWLGFIGADGCHHIRPNGTEKISINLAVRDYGHLEKFRDFVKSDKPICVSGGGATFEVCSSKFSNDLGNLGIVPRKSLVYKPFLCPRQFEKDYWRGYFDGDGSQTRYLTKNKKTVFSIDLLGTKEVLESFNGWVASLGISVNPVRTDRNVFKVSYSAKREVEVIMDAMYSGSTIYLDRKFKWYLEFKKELLLTPAEPS